MKAIIRVPMKESFGYIEFEVEDASANTAVEIYQSALKASKAGTSDNDF